METLNSMTPEAIAVVGIGCRMPGDVRNPTDFWTLLVSKGIANKTKVPPSRFNIDAYLHPSNERPGSFNVPGGYFLEDDPKEFDPGMFKISPVEELWMDPQQRKLLEVVYEAFENGGTTLEKVDGCKIGCFVGCFTSDFLQMTAKEPDFRHAYVSTGVDPGILGNRISYVFNLKGPSLTVNTACSSSLYALDIACKAIHSGECDGAIIGGTNLILTVDQQMNTARLGVLSPTNQCHTFDETADGYGRAEGVGAFYIKPLSAAVRDGDPIRAIIRSTATGSSGKCEDGMTHPSLQAQIDVIKRAHKLANLTPDHTTYVECHGTGTPIGDPIEVEAVHRALGVGRPQDAPVLIGSVKPNIGHSEAASSMGTLIKAILALENGIIPRSAGITKLSSRIPWEEYNVKVVTEPTPFPKSTPVHRIGVSAFGYGGTNAHTILESTQSLIPGYHSHKFMHCLKGVPDGLKHEDPDADRPYLLLFSAHDVPTLKNNLADYLGCCNDAQLIDLAYTLGLRRTKFPQRAFAVVRKESLESDIKVGMNDITSFSGQALIPAFAFTGELGAAFAAGHMSAEGAITAAYFRGKLAASLDTDGAMLAVGAGAIEASEYIEAVSCHGKVVVGCHNSPSSATLSGDRKAIEELKEILDGKNIFARVLKTGGKAYHSHHMKAAAARYEAYLDAIPNTSASNTLKIPMFSTVRSEYIIDQGDSILNSYWVDNLVSPVLFRQGVQHMLSSMPQINTVIEVGPHTALAGPLRQIWQAANKGNMQYLPTLKRKEHDGEQVLRLAGKLWANDASIDINAVLNIEKMTKGGAIEMRTGSLLVDLPTYHWTYLRPCWTESRFSEEARTMKEPRHDILGRRLVGLSALEPVWRNILRQKDLPWLAQHRVGGEVMLPGAGYIALAIEAITQVNAELGEPLPIYSYTVRDVVISSATVVPDDDVGTETVFRLQSLDGKHGISSNGRTSQWYQFAASCCSLPDMPQCRPSIDWLDKLRTFGIDLGPAFHHISNISSDGETHTARGDMVISTKSRLMEAESRYLLHPTVLDSCLQLVLAAVHQGQLEGMRCGTILTHFGEVTIFPPSPEQLANRCILQTWIPQLGNRAYTYDSQLIAHDGSLLVDISGGRQLEYKAALPREMRGNLQRDLYIRTDWKIDADYLSWANEAGDLSYQPLATVVDLLLHKDVTTRTLCLDESLVASILTMRLTASMTIAASSKEAKDAIAERYAENEAITIVNWGIDSLETAEAGGQYDLVIIPMTHHADLQVLENIREIIADEGRLLLRTSIDAIEEWCVPLRSSGFSGIDEILPDGIVMTTAVHRRPVSNHRPLVNNSTCLVYRDAPSSLLSVVSKRLINDGWNVRSRAIDSIDGIEGGQVVLLVDAEGPFLAQLKAEQLNGLIYITENASAVTWVTCGGLLTGDKPEFGMTEGAARVIRNEKGSLDLVTLDFDVETTSEYRVAELLADILTRQQTKGRNGETEYYMKNGVVHIGRLVSHRDLHREFVSDSGEKVTLYQRDRPAVQGRLENGTLVFCRDDRRVAEPLGVEDVEVQVAAIGITESDGDDDTTILSHEIAGTVTRVGADVHDIFPGTKVRGLAFDRLATLQRTSSHLVQPLPPSCHLTEAATLPSAFVTALYGLEELARIQPDENVAIIDGMGGVALAAIQLCHILKANAIVVTSAAVTKDSILNSGVISSGRIVYSRDGTLSTQLEVATAGRGVDIIFCSSAVDEATIIGCGYCMAQFGRLVTVGPAKAPTSVMPGIDLQAKGLSSFHFDLRAIAWGRQRIVARGLYIEGTIKPFRRSIVKRPAEIYDAIQSTPRELGSAKRVVTYDEDTSFKVLPSRMPLVLRGEVTYLMVGCLGGLGREVALWMAEGGAKHLAFVSRTGADKPAAAATVQSLRAGGVEVTVLRADVLKREEISRVVGKVNHAFPIRGVVNAAAILHDCVFRNMTIKAWQEVSETKVRGSQNLHEVLRNEPLDFFVMTSSITATLGSTGQSNYGAANSFMDSLARHRRCRHLAAVSLNLPAILGVGLIHESKDLQRSIKAKGMYGIHWKEMLNAFEIAMTPMSSLPPNVDHIAVGIQPRLFGQAIKAVGAHIPWKEEPRLNWLASAVKEQVGGELQPGATNSSSESIIATIQQAPSKEQAVDAVASYITRRLARLLMIEEESIQPTKKSVASHGLDSMIGAEFRNWIYREFKVDVPFQKLLAGSGSVSELAKTLCEKVNEMKP
ncbi:hypothetical protein DL771_002819 [Monosporascus sp. 5C6A]|nr:hypothetical protein DL771_002819 [Monosporascus sp. 5C6A]